MSSHEPDRRPLAGFLFSAAVGIAAYLFLWWAIS